MSFTINSESGDITLHRYYAVKKDNPVELLKGFDDINDCREYCILTGSLIYDTLLKEVRNDIY